MGRNRSNHLFYLSLGGGFLLLGTIFFPPKTFACGPEYGVPCPGTESPSSSPEPSSPSTPSTAPTTSPDTGGHNTQEQLGKTFDPGGGKGIGGPSVFDTPGGGGGDRIKVDPFEVRREMVKQVTEILRDIDRQKQLKVVLKPHINALKEARQNLDKVSKDYSRTVRELREASKEVDRWREVHNYYKSAKGQEGQSGTFEKATREALERELNNPKYQEAVRNEREALQRWGEVRQGVDKAIDNIHEAKQHFKSGPQILDLPPVQ